VAPEGEVLMQAQAMALVAGVVLSDRAQHLRQPDGLRDPH